MQTFLRNSILQKHLHSPKDKHANPSIVNLFVPKESEIILTTLIFTETVMK